MSNANEIFPAFGELNDFERSLLQLLSIIYEPANSTLIVSCLRKLELHGPRGNRPTTARVNHLVSKLQELGLINDQHQCTLEIVEMLSRCAVAEGFFNRCAEVVRKEAPASYYYGKWSTRCWRAVRELRIGIYSLDFDLIDQALHFLDHQCRGIPTPHPPIIQIVTCPFDRSWFRTLPPSFQFFLLNHIVSHGQQQLVAAPEIISYLADEREFQHLDVDEYVPFLRLLFNHYLMQGELSSAETLLERNRDAFSTTGSEGALAFLKGDLDHARHAFTRDLDELATRSATHAVAFFGPQGLFHILSELRGKRGSELHLVVDRISVALDLFEDSEESDAYRFLAAVADQRAGQRAISTDVTLPKDKIWPSITVLFAGLAQYWLTASLEPDIESEVHRCFARARENGYHLFSITFADLLSRIAPKPEPYRKTIRELTETTGLIPFLATVEPEEPWKRSLQALIHVSTTAVHPRKGQDTRLIWLIDHQGNDVIVRPREQKQTSDGRWSKGRPVSLERLQGADKLPYLSLADRKICLAIRKDDSGEGRPHYYFNREKLLTALVGHPLLFLNEAMTTPVEVISGEPELYVEEQGDDLHINFSMPITAENILMVQETPTRFKVVRIRENHRRIAQITGQNGLTVPREASEQVLTAIGNISSFMTVHSAIAVDASSRQSRDITFVEADSTPYIHMLPYGSGFRLEMFVKPFKEGNHYLKPGIGVENIMAEVGGTRLQTKRNLAEEERKAREIEELCPILDLAIDLEQGNEREWHLHDPDDCLQALLELQEISDRVVVEWPEGEKLTVTHKASFKNLNLKVRTNRQNWFGISGELVLDQDLLIDLKELLQKIDKAPGRFIQIAEGQFIALTQEFKKRLEDLNSFSSNGKATEHDEIIVHPLAALQLEELTEQACVEADRSWRDHFNLIKQSHSFRPEPPSTLQAELRDYQLEGYYWLSRLARWGVGGCLADDMGLGKTLQSLAVILGRAADGPSLVIAPTSVSTNWLGEVSRFTPTLNIKQLTPKDRTDTIDSLTKFDLLITTYTLLQQEIDQLRRIPWQTIVLDEAQAIKNAATKRSQAAMALQGGFKLITTGTPIENHLGELWNLFQFINPGLLGSHKQFNERFAIPIERFNDREARLRLKKLIRPFILRRIKSQVLEELPPRTEITLEVTMSDEEMHFYEALRQHALEMLEGSSATQKNHLQILTEIMKLRQACCNPRLIVEDSPLPSAKLNVFAALIEELLAGRHKALVFSQFIGHLDIIREHLDSRKITYQYLDGSTGSRQRRERVEAFQAGEGDLFLISLKAGGLGLNLTAADYVIHMDPWWNPAVEDQASDRAHRIGQTRPVTIYRLVCRHTIEEKIVRLHQEKRDLADSLLEGADMSARLSTEQLMNLIRDS